MYTLWLALQLALQPATLDDRAAELDTVQVLGRQQNLLRRAISASEGVVGPVELESRPRLRSGDLVEYVPGLVATQHSGSGKANQYFLRGFNLDHGTDFATRVAGMPVNLRSHGHGQGYTDLNFLIPELVEELRYRKGPYRAQVGDFSAAGGAEFELASTLPEDRLSVGIGEDGFRRALLAGSLERGRTTWTGAVEDQRYDGPWSDIDEDGRRQNLALGLGGALGGGRGQLWLLAYDAEWNSPDQIPQRAVEQGLIDRLGTLDRTLGGASSRYSLSGQWNGPVFGWETQVSAYAIDYDLELFSNFTYFLDDPDRGDQFRQFDERTVYGFDGRASRALGPGTLGVGLEARRDDIDHVGLSRTQARRFTSAIRDDQVEEDSAAAHVDWQQDLSSRWRLYLGARYDRYLFDVDALQPENSGRNDDGITSLKSSLAFAASESLELYLSAGQGFHSNDARGTVIAVDPVNGDPAAPVDPLVRSRGAEIGARWQLPRRFQATLDLWFLQLDSELLFVGDAGNTEATDASRRRGAELGLYWFADARWQAELELGWTHAKLSGRADNHIPGAIPRVLAAGLSADLGRGWTAAARLRHFGDYPLIEDGSVRAEDATVVNLRIGKRFTPTLHMSVDVLNALDSDDRDIEYFYASRLPGEPDAGVDDVHFHPLEPRAVRASVEWAW